MPNARYPTRGVWRKRSAKYKSSSAALRYKKVAAARKRVRSLVGRKRTIVSNTRKIAKLTDTQWGPVQQNVALYSGAEPILADAPVLIHGNNFHSGNHGPHIYQYHPTAFSNLTGTKLKSCGTFSPFSGLSGFFGNHDYHENDHKHIPNGNRMKMLSLEFEFQFSCLASQRNVRVDIVRQKKLDSDFYLQSDGDNYLPSTASGFTHLAGFTPNKIDTKTFEICASRSLQLDSKGVAYSATSLTAHTGNQTGTKRTCKIKLNLNKVQKQLKHSVNETNALDTITTDRSNAADSQHIISNWSFDNVHPLSNYWVVISSDDAQDYSIAQAGITSAAAANSTAHAVTCNIIRKVTWRDLRD